MALWYRIPQAREYQEQEQDQNQNQTQTKQQYPTKGPRKANEIFATFPDDVLVCIFKKVSNAKELLRMRTVSKLWNRIIGGNREIWATVSFSGLRFPRRVVWGPGPNGKAAIGAITGAGAGTGGANPAAAKCTCAVNAQTCSYCICNTTTTTSTTTTTITTITTITTPNNTNTNTNTNTNVYLAIPTSSLEEEKMIPQNNEHQASSSRVPPPSQAIPRRRILLSHPGGEQFLRQASAYGNKFAELLHSVMFQETRISVISLSPRDASRLMNAGSNRALLAATRDYHGLLSPSKRERLRRQIMQGQGAIHNIIELLSDCQVPKSSWVAIHTSYPEYVAACVEEEARIRALLSTPTSREPKSSKNVKNHNKAAASSSRSALPTLDDMEDSLSGNDSAASASSSSSSSTLSSALASTSASTDPGESRPAHSQPMSITNPPIVSVPQQQQQSSNSSGNNIPVTKGGAILGLVYVGDVRKETDWLLAYHALRRAGSQGVHGGTLNALGISAVNHHAHGHFFVLREEAPSSSARGFTPGYRSYHRNMEVSRVNSEARYSQSHAHFYNSVNVVNPVPVLSSSPSSSSLNSPPMSSVMSFNDESHASAISPNNTNSNATSRVYKW
eukprot:CAMPEP_0184694648 /NCGR_PEP_ID=MMETSP0313-20130426/2527_1 /TAXON_ID=2792 /ORGANISM="Porphyridium aerugineum, Strain SAG 1380-2" /LENGTH=616 /DNA_ID=CAMNT_0027152969 /DNA_START=459 /DNA_END=2306 /DNA_ORIENTATION=+